MGSKESRWVAVSEPNRSFALMPRWKVQWDADRGSGYISRDITVNTRCVSDAEKVAAKVMGYRHTIKGSVRIVREFKDPLFYKRGDREKR